MTRFIEYVLDDGSTLYVEVKEEPVSGRVVPGSKKERTLIERADKTFDEAVDGARTAADTLLRKLRTLSERPDEIEVTFGLTASGELGGNFFVAKAGLEANYSVKMTWNQTEQEKNAK